MILTAEIMAIQNRLKVILAANSVILSTEEIILMQKEIVDCMAKLSQRVDKMTRQLHADNMGITQW